MVDDQANKANFASEMERVERLAVVGRHVEAVAVLNDLASRHPDRFEPYFRRAMSKHSLNDRVGAIGDLTEAIELNPDEPASFFFRGRWRIEAGAYADGISDLRRAILVDESQGSTYYAGSARFSLAVAYFLAKQFKQSELACRGVSADASTYLAGRLWTMADLRR